MEAVVEASAELMGLFSPAENPVSLPCTIDVNGSNDEPGQGDLTKFCSDNTTANTQNLQISWDKINWTGQSGDACLLFNTDGDQGINYALCVGVEKDTVTDGIRVTNVTGWSCNDRTDKPVNCFDPTATTAVSGVCTAAVENTDPFYNSAFPPDSGTPNGTGEAYPNDTVATCVVTYSGVLANTSVEVSNVCAYTQPGDAGSNAKDCLAQPAGGFITVVKVANPNDSTAFPFTINDGAGFTPIPFSIIGSATSNRYSVATGTYSVKESIPGGWDLTDASCKNGGITNGTWSGDTVSSVVVGASDNIICTFNDVKRGHLIVSKVTEPSSDTTTQFGVTASGTGTISPPAIRTLTGNGSSTDYEVTPATYSVAESTIPTGWEQVTNTCQNVEVAAGATQACTITNRKKPELRVNKVLMPSSDTGKFNLLINGTTYATDVGNGGTTGAQFANIGANTVAEVEGTGTNLSNYVTTYGGDCDGSGNVTLAAGENKTCTITNARRGTVIINKTAINGNATFNYTASGDGLSNFNITTAGGSGSQQFANLAPGDKTVTEGTLPDGWAFTELTCSDPDGGTTISGMMANIDLDPGETVECTYTNTNDIMPDITVTKTANPTEVSETGGNVTFTYVVTNNASEPATITALSDDRFGTLTGDADCAVDTILAAGASCSFEATFAVPAGATGSTHVNVFTATAKDSQNNTDTATDNATVTRTDVLPDITVTKTANPTAVPETGGNVVFTFRVTNNSAEAAIISSLSDSVYGTLTGDTDCNVGTTVMDYCEFSITRFVSGDFSGAAHRNVFTANATDNDGNTATDDDDATVTFDDVLPDDHRPEDGGPDQRQRAGRQCGLHLQGHQHLPSSR